MSNLTSQEIELLINEQRNLLASGNYSKNICHYNMGYLKRKYNVSVGLKERINVDTCVLKQSKECSICYTNHPFNDLLKTNCNHYFGRSCYLKWKNRCPANRVTCPYCRESNPGIFLFVENNFV